VCGCHIYTKYLLLAVVPSFTSIVVLGLPRDPSHRSNSSGVAIIRTVDLEQSPEFNNDNTVSLGVKGFNKNRGSADTRMVYVLELVN
jgi:hypothetical protein